MKIENFQKTYTLEPAAVDEIAERIEGFLGSIKMERAKITVCLNLKKGQIT